MEAAQAIWNKSFSPSSIRRDQKKDALTQHCGCMLHPPRKELDAVVQLYPERQGSLSSLFQIKY